MTEKQQHQVNIERANQYRVLQSNIQFEALVLRHYFHEYVLTLHEQLNEYPQGSEQYHEIIRKLDAIAVTKSYFLGLEEAGRWSEEELKFLMTNPNGDLDD